MATRLIDLHKEWCETMAIKDCPERGCGGLCNALPVKYLKPFRLFTPDEYGDNDCYWASQMKPQGVGGRYENSELYGYNPLRQTIVLLICAMNNEL